MKKLISISLIIVALFIVQDAEAQCSMCKAVVESGSHGNEGLAEGINSGILYMMGMPYLLMMIIGFAWYKKYYKPGKEN